MSRTVCICVPARNEAAHLPILIEALADQTIDWPLMLALCVNNSEDGSAERARASVAQAEGRILLRLLERDFAPGLAHAGSARRAAMDLAADWVADENALLLSTDADCRPPPDWVAANLRAALPDRIVGGRILLDEREADAPPALFALRERFDAYWARVRTIEDAIDPVDWDLPPRHGDHTGASLALAVDLYRRAGGVPLVATGEDRALVAAAVACGGKLVHPISVWTRASCRIAGRAADGMARDMRAWLQAVEDDETPSVPDFRHWQARASWRRAQRCADVAGLAEAEAQLPPMPCDMALPMSATS